MEPSCRTLVPVRLSDVQSSLTRASVYHSTPTIRANSKRSCPSSNKGLISPVYCSSCELSTRRILSSFRRASGLSMSKQSIPPPMQSLERRKGLRFAIATSAWFQWCGTDREIFQGEGVTRDISAQGALITTPNAPPVGSRVELAISLSPTRAGTVLRGVGTVLRVSESEDKISTFAVSAVFKSTHDKSVEGHSG